jgi:predicted transcriptional regulator
VRKSNFEIVAEILKYAEHGALFTQIMYGCQLSYRQATSYVQLLLGQGLLRAEDYYSKVRGGVRHFIRYVTTERGRAYVQLFRQVKRMLEGEKIEVKV